MVIRIQFISSHLPVVLVPHELSKSGRLMDACTPSTVKYGLNSRYIHLGIILARNYNERERYHFAFCWFKGCDDWTTGINVGIVQ